MNYLQQRFGQVSTWIGVAIAGFSLYQSHGAITPDIVSSLLAALGLVHVNDTPALPR